MRVSDIHIFIKSILNYNNYKLVEPMITLKEFDRWARNKVIVQEISTIFKIIVNYHTTNEESKDLTMGDLRLLANGSDNVPLVLDLVEAAPAASGDALVYKARRLKQAYAFLQIAQSTRFEKNPSALDWDGSIIPRIQKDILTDWDFGGDLTEFHQVKGKTGVEWVETGFSAIDTKIPRPLPKKGFHLFAGVKGHGKTTFLCNLAISMLRKGYNIMFSCREMTPDEIKEELLLIAGTDEAGFQQALKHYGSRLWLVHTGYSGPGVLRNYLDRLTNEGVTVDVIVDDYLKLWKVPPRSEIRFEHEQRALEAKKVADDYNIALVTAWQLAPATEREIFMNPAYKIKLSDLSEAKEAVGSHAYSVWGLWADKHAYTTHINLISLRKYRGSWDHTFSMDPKTGKLSC